MDSSFRKSYSDINGFACKDANEAAVMLWNYHDDDIQSEAEAVAVRLKGLPNKQVLLQHYRIDSTHSNSYEVWKKMGSPKSPSAEQITELEKAGQLQLLRSPQWIKPKNGEAMINMVLPRQGVSLLKLDW